MNCNTTLNPFCWFTGNQKGMSSVPIGPFPSASNFQENILHSNARYSLKMKTSSIVSLLSFTFPALM